MWSTADSYKDDESHPCLFNTVHHTTTEDFVSELVATGADSTDTMENRSRISVLYVGGDSYDRRITKLLLNESNINVLFVESFRQTIFWAAAQNFDAFLVDGSIASQETLLLCRVLRRSHPAKPIMCFSCAAPDSEIESAMTAGATTYLTKPYLGNLATAVMDAVQTAASGSALLVQ